MLTITVMDSAAESEGAQYVLTWKDTLRGESHKCVIFFLMESDIANTFSGKKIAFKTK